MNAVTCPRCRQDWLSDDQPEASERLCSTCVADLRAAGRDPERRYGRGPRRRKDAMPVPYFLLYVVLLIGINLMAIGLALLLPHPIAKVCLIFGCVEFVGAAIAFRFVTGYRIYRVFQDFDWNYGRWPFAAALAGIACAVAAAQIMITHRVG